jgi:hypothetical protein
MLATVTAVQFLTDIWSMFLGGVICLLVSQYLLRKSAAQRRGLEEVSLRTFVVMKVLLVAQLRMGVRSL